MKKRVVSIILAGALVVSMGAMAGCGSSSDDTSGDDTTSTAAETTDSSAEEETDSTAESGTGEYDLSSLDDGEVYTLTVQSHDPENSATGTFLNDWAEAVEEASEGHLEIDVYHGATLGGAKDTIDMIQNGTCDIGWGLQSFFSDVFPVTEVFMLPLLDIETTIQGSTAIWDFYNTTDYMDDEYSDYHVLLLHTNCQSPISTVSTKIESVSDLQGMQLRGNSGPPTDFIEDLGANPVSVAINDLYSNLDKGTLDGCITDWHAISSFSLDETISYYLDEDLGVSTYFLLMNTDSYDGLPEVLQQILDDVSSDSIQYTSAWDDVQAEIKAEVADKIYNLSDEERANLEEIAAQTTEDWIAEMDSLGYDGQAIYDAAIECIENAK